MFKIFEIIRDKSIEGIIKKILALIWLSLIPILLWFRDFAFSIIQYIPKEYLVISILVLLTLFLLSIIIIVRLHKRNKDPLDGYEFDEKKGILRNPGDKIIYCLSCMLKKTKSPMKVQENGWLCLNKDCNKFYPNPDYKDPVFQPIIRSRRNWAMDWDKY